MLSLACKLKCIHSWVCFRSCVLIAAAVGNDVREDEFGYRNQCGVYALQVALGSIKAETDVLDSLRNDGEQHSLRDLQEIATSHGIPSVALNWRHATLEFPLGRCPAILPVIEGGAGHFVTLLAAQRGHFLIASFPHHPRWIPRATVTDTWEWDGTALHFAQSEDQLPQGVETLMHAAFSAVVVLVGAFVVFRKRHLRAPRRKLTGRSGFTLIELLACIGICTLLAVMLSPAIQAARENARGSQCRNNLKQIGLAITAYESAHHWLPPSYPSMRHPTSSNGIDGRLHSRPGNNLSVFTRILPYLGNQTLYGALDLDNEVGAASAGEPPLSLVNHVLQQTSIPMFLCPSDPIAVGSSLSYRTCEGTTPGGWMQSEERGSSDAFYLGPFFRYGVPLARITDGLSHTAFCAEKLCGDRESSTYTAWRDLAQVEVDMSSPNSISKSCSLVTASQKSHYSFGGAAWLFAGFEQSWYNHILGPNSAYPDCNNGLQPAWLTGGAFGSRSLHPGNVHVLTGDGAVHRVSDNVDQRVWRAMGSASGGETTVGAN